MKRRHNDENSEHCWVCYMHRGGGEEDDDHVEF